MQNLKPKQRGERKKRNNTVKSGHLGPCIAGKPLGPKFRVGKPY
jgi:hypothetical protein